MPEQKQNQPGAQGILERIRENLGQEKNEGITEAAAPETVLQKEAGPLSEIDQGNVGKDEIPVIHTLQGDISEYVKTRDMSLVDIAAEATKRRRFDDDIPERPKKTAILIAGILFLIGILTAGGWFLLKKERASPAETNLETPKPLILSEETKIIILNLERKTSLINLAQEALNAAIPLNTIRYLPILLKTKEKEEYLDAKNFLDILNASPPANFIQSLDGPFTFGMFYLKRNSPILIFKIHSFDLAFNGVLNWEKNMARDLKEIMFIKNLPVSQNFRDKIIKNRDARILYDESEKPVLIHSFVDKERLVIAADLDSLEEIFERLTATN